jgi:hypothetical protein
MWWIKNTEYPVNMADPLLFSRMSCFAILADSLESLSDHAIFLSVIILLREHLVPTLLADASDQELTVISAQVWECMLNECSLPELEEIWTHNSDGLFVPTLTCASECVGVHVGMTLAVI